MLDVTVLFRHLKNIPYLDCTRNQRLIWRGGRGTKASLLHSLLVTVSMYYGVQGTERRLVTRILETVFWELCQRMCACVCVNLRLIWRGRGIKALFLHSLLGLFPCIMVCKELRTSENKHTWNCVFRDLGNRMCVYMNLRLIWRGVRGIKAPLLHNLLVTVFMYYGMQGTESKWKQAYLKLCV